MSGTSTKDGGFGAARLGMRLLAAVAEEQQPGPDTAADDDEQAHDRDDQLEFALGRGCGFGAFARAFRLFVVRHRSARSGLFRKNELDAARQAHDAIQMPPAHTRSPEATLR